MKNPILVITIIAAITLATDVQAQRSTISEFRGYQACLEANANQFKGLVAERHYLLEQTDSGRIYYINTTAWEDGKRVPVGIACETTANGYKILNREVSYTRFAPTSSKRSIQIAGQ